MEDLNWAAIKDLTPLDSETETKAREITRDRSKDLTVQEPPSKRPRVEETPVPVVTDNVRRSKRVRARSTKLKDYHVGTVRVMFSLEPMLPNDVLDPEGDPIDPTPDCAL